MPPKYRVIGPLPLEGPLKIQADAVNETLRVSRGYIPTVVREQKAKGDLQVLHQQANNYRAKAGRRAARVGKSNPTVGKTDYEVLQMAAEDPIYEPSADNAVITLADPLKFTEEYKQDNAYYNLLMQEYYNMAKTFNRWNSSGNVLLQAFAPSQYYNLSNLNTQDQSYAYGGKIAPHLFAGGGYKTLPTPPKDSPNAAYLENIRLQWEAWDGNPFIHYTPTGKWDKDKKHCYLKMPGDRKFYYMENGKEQYGWRNDLPELTPEESLYLIGLKDYYVGPHEYRLPIAPPPASSTPNKGRNMNGEPVGASKTALAYFNDMRGVTQTLEQMADTAKMGAGVIGEASVAEPYYAEQFKEDTNNMKRMVDALDFAAAVGGLATGTARYLLGRKLAHGMRTSLTKAGSKALSPSTYYKYGRWDNALRPINTGFEGAGTATSFGSAITGGSEQSRGVNVLEGTADVGAAGFNLNTRYVDNWKKWLPVAILNGWALTKPLWYKDTEQ